MSLTHLLGAHISAAGGIQNALRRGHELQCTTIQIFTKSPNQWKERCIERADGLSFQALRQEMKIAPVIAHAGYLINLASPFRELYERSIDAIVREVARCEELGIPYLVIHPGSHTGCGEERAIELLVDALDAVHEQTVSSSLTILLEISAGQGTSMGSTLEQIARMIDSVQESKRIGFCLDTCHAFAAGYEFRTKADYQRFIDKIGTIIGLERLLVIHLNDSKSGCGSKVDRHEHIGKGMIGERPFGWFMRDERLRKIPKIIETPGLGKDLATDRMNLERLRKLAEE
ncbi:MAG TPA: deoxyribonuclease IV [Deltaproteobacteria bacterium]|nr:deoxyribonuclease IV [Deltaproteobacteria bacterium]